METLEVDSKLLRRRITNNRHAHTPKGRYVKYKSRAKENGREFKLSREEFIQLFISNCHYCGSENARGIDRIDSDKGYIEGNVLPCCSICNFMKKNHPYDLFISQVIKIAKNLT